jgi:integrase
MASIAKRTYTTSDGKERTRYQARYRADGREYMKNFTRKAEAQTWLDKATAAIQAGTHINPKHAKMTVAAWADFWIEGYRVNRASTVRQAEMHLAKIKAQFGSQKLGSVTPTQVKNWTAKLQTDGLSASYIYALHGRLSQLYSDAIHDGVVAKSPCSRRTSPPAGEQVAYVATTEQVWALHDAMPEHLRGTILLGAFAGLRAAEVCGLRVSDVDYMQGIVTPAKQYPAVALKTKASRTPVPIPADMALELSAHVAAARAEGPLFMNEWRDQLSPRTMERAFRAARATVIAAEVEAGVPVTSRLHESFRFHDLRHYFASYLIVSGLDIKTVQACMRHASAKTTLDTYGHLWPDSGDTTRAAVGAAFTARPARRSNCKLRAV